MQYELFTSRVGFDFETMSDADAEDYFRCFLDRVPGRLAQLERIVLDDNARPWIADYSDESLVVLARWLARSVTTRPMTAGEVAALRAMGGLVDHIELPSHELSVKAMSIAVDCGIYFAETLRARNPSLNWQCLMAPRDHMYFHRAVLVGFKYQKQLDPITIGYVQARKVARDGDYVPQLVSLAEIWTDLVDL